MINLHPGDIDLWLTDYARITDTQLLDRYWLFLSSIEREQQKRFYFERDRLRYLVTRALVRTVLSRYLPLSETAWIFATNAYGRPHIANPAMLAEDFHFNISHTHSLIVLAVARGREVGVDVENTSAGTVDIGIADQFFAAAEVSALSNVTAEQQQFRFLEYWTFKESYIKARGMGLSIPLDKFSFDFPGDGHVRIEIDAELADEAHRWEFWQFQPRAEYLVAVCAEGIPAQPARLRLRNIVPGSATHVIAPTLTRTSESANMIQRLSISRHVGR